MRSLVSVLFFLAANRSYISASKDVAGHSHTAIAVAAPSESISLPVTRKGHNSSVTTTAHIYTNTTAESMNCSASWNAWLESSLDAGFNLSTFTTTYTYHNMTAQLTTLCDGHPRIVGGLTTTATGTNSTLTSTAMNFTTPPPKCEPVATDCSSLYEQRWILPCTHTKGLDCGQCNIWGGSVSRPSIHTSSNKTLTSSKGSIDILPSHPT